MKILIVIILLYLAYRALKYRLGFHVLKKPETPKDSGKQIDDVMVQDPFCKVYFPKNSGVTLKVNGETLYFCSQECRDNYLSDRPT